MSQTVDNSKPSPQIVFQVNLSRLGAEKIGPKTNQTSGTVLSPDMYANGSAMDVAGGGMVAARDNAAIRDGCSLLLTNGQTITIASQKVAALPGFLRGMGVNHSTGYQFIEYGQKALYLQSTYCNAAIPELNWLTVVQTNNPPLTNVVLPISGFALPTVRDADVT